MENLPNASTQLYFYFLILILVVSLYGCSLRNEMGLKLAIHFAISWPNFDHQYPAPQKLII